MSAALREYSVNAKITAASYPGVNAEIAATSEIIEDVKAAGLGAL